MMQRWHQGLTIEDLINEIQSKFENINTRLNQIESNLESKIKEQVNENIMSIKDSIITALKTKMKYFESKSKKLAENEKSFKKTGPI